MEQLTECQRKILKNLIFDEVYLMKLLRKLEAYHRSNYVSWLLSQQLKRAKKMQRIRGLLHYLQQDSLQLEIRRHDTIDLICSLREVIYFWPVEMQEKMDITCRIQHYEERDLKKMASRLCIYEPDYIFLTQGQNAA